MIIDELYIRKTLRRVTTAGDIFHAENVFLNDDRGAIIGLNLSERDLSDIGFLTAFKDLRYLNLGFNRIQDASPLAELHYLEKVELTGNQIDDLAFVLRLKNLKYVDVQSNLVRRLPPSFAKLGIPICWDSLFTADGIILDGNPLESPPPEVVQRGTNEAKAYLAALSDGDESLNELKVVVLGRSEAGKTTLVRRLCGEPAMPDERPTDGINFRFARSTDQQLKVHVWDFGRTELLHATRALFFSKRTAYLIILDAARRDTPDYWLALVRMFSPACPVFVIINKVDELDDPDDAYYFNRTELRTAWPNIQGIFSVSCTADQDQGLRHFLSQFWKQSPTFELPQIQFKRGWQKVRDELLRRSDPLMDLNAYLLTCESNGLVDRDEQNELLTALNDLGLVLHFQGSRIEDYIVLDPRWLWTAANTVLGIEGAEIRDGATDRRVLERRLDSLEPGCRTTERRFVVDVLEKFEICLAITDDKLFVPDLLPAAGPGTQALAPPQAEIRAEFRFDNLAVFNPLPIFHRLVVRLWEDIRYDHVWSTGAILEEKFLQAGAAIGIDEPKNLLVIRTFGPRRKEYLTIIRKAVRDSLRSAGDLNLTEYVPLPGEEELVAYSKLLRLREGGIRQHLSVGTQRPFEVDALLGSVEAIVRDIAPAASNNSTSTSPGSRFCFVSYSRSDLAFAEDLVERLESEGIEVWYDRKIKHGKWDNTLDQKVLDSSVFIVIVTPESHKSASVNNELTLAINHDIPVIPIQLHKVKSWGKIITTQYHFADHEDFFSRLLDAIRDILASPKQ
jgi:GTPase SAR1 family protein